MSPLPGIVVGIDQVIHSEQEIGTAGKSGAGGREYVPTAPSELLVRFSVPLVTR